MVYIKLLYHIFVSWFEQAFIDADTKNKVVFSLNYYLGKMKFKDKF
jgi:hypothetical protein